METVLVRAPESIDFGLKSPEKPCKSRKKSAQISLGRRCRRFESCHSDQNLCFMHWKISPFRKMRTVFCLLSPTRSPVKRPQFFTKRFFSAQDTGFGRFFVFICWVLFQNFFAYCTANFEGWQIDFCQPSLLSSSRQIGIYRYKSILISYLSSMSI